MQKNCLIFGEKNVKQFVKGLKGVKKISYDFFLPAEISFLSKSVENYVLATFPAKWLRAYHFGPPNPHPPPHFAFDQIDIIYHFFQ